MPTLGILFDIDKIDQHVDSGNYLRGAWKVVWRAIDISSLNDWSGAFLYECDTEGNDRGCCVAIQSMDKLLLQKIRDSLSQSAEYQKVADPPMFLLDESARAQPLMEAGTIDRSGNVTGEKAYCSAPALDAVRKEGS
jgi:hypothetical protein